MNLIHSFFQLILVGILVTFGGNSFATEPELSLDVFVSEPNEINVTSVLIKGTKEVMVVSAQGTKSAATRLANKIEATGLDLKYIFLTHPHLDHSQGASVLIKRFPDARFIATPEIASLQRHRMELDDKLASSRYGENAAIPSAPAQDYLEKSLFIDGVEIEIWKNIVGDAGIGHADEPHVALYIPSIHALIPSDVVYFEGHVMMGGSTPKSRKLWVEQLKNWQKLNLNVVVPGHMPKAKKQEWNAEKALNHTVDYITKYDLAIKQSKSAEELIATMLTHYPDLEHQSALYLSAYLDFGQMHMLTFNPTIERIANWLPESFLQWINMKIFGYKKEQYSLDEH